MQARLFKTEHTDFEEVYVFIDTENERLHVSPVNYQYNITLDLHKDLHMQLENQTKWGDTGFNKKVRKVVKEIIHELDLAKRSATL